MSDTVTRDHRNQAFQLACRNLRTALDEQDTRAVTPSLNVGWRIAQVLTFDPAWHATLGWIVAAALRQAEPETR